MDIGLRDKTAVVLGSTSGIGLAVARTLHAEGASVALCGRQGARARAEAEALGPRAMGVEVDLAEGGAPEVVVEAARQHFGRIDIVVLNSGAPPGADAAGFTEEQLRAALDQLLLAQRRLVELTLPDMRATAWGRIVGIGSSGIQRPIPHLALSNIARAGLAAYLKSLAAVVARDGVTVNMVLPGRIASSGANARDEARAQRAGVSMDEMRSRYATTIPAARYGTPEEFAQVAAFLCGTPASYVTGEQIRCDGGYVESY